MAAACQSGPAGPRRRYDSTMRLKLYVTGGCHLCEDAQAVLAQAGLAEVVERVEIGYDTELAERYGRRIPVLRIEPDGVEIDWPFGASDLPAGR